MSSSFVDSTPVRRLNYSLTREPMRVSREFSP